MLIFGYSACRPSSCHRGFLSLMKSDITSREFISSNDSIFSETLQKSESAARRKSQIQAQTESERKQRRGKTF